MRFRVLESQSTSLIVPKADKSVNTKIILRHYPPPLPTAHAVELVAVSPSVDSRFVTTIIPAAPSVVHMETPPSESTST
jgi:hypothetical protein